MSDRYGRKLPLIIGMSFVPVLFALYSWAGSVSWVLILRLGQGVIEAPIWVAGETSIVELSSREERGKALGMFGSSWATGFAAGPLIGGFLYTFISAGNSFLICAVISIPAIVLLGTARFSKTGSYTSIPKIDFRKILLPGLIAFTYAGVIGVIITLFPPYGRELGMTEAVVGGLVTIFSMTRAIFLTPIGHLVDKIKRRKITLVSLSGSAIGFAALGFVVNFVLIGLILGILAILGCVLYPITGTMFSDIGSERGMGYAFGIYNAIWMGGWGLFPSIGGRLADVVSSSAPYLMCAGVLFFIAVFSWFLMDRSKS
ncbi:hypothetical protein AKJ61_02560 [candidate division MSBL1 archaeon SCGC-AAA259B11]|nr:hypothetical protein AKJ61_02560 [candidate division MSBL1 archaeon SCGC-AAA259B11]